MQKFKKFSRPALIALAAVTCGIVMFQNCSKVSFNSAPEASGVIESASEGPTKTAYLNVTQTQTYAPFKLLIVVDNSHTMSQTQQRLTQNLDSLLNALDGKDVEVKVISTSQQNGYEIVTYDLTKAFNRYGPEYYNQSYPGFFERAYTYFNWNLPSINLGAAANPGERYQKKQLIKSYISSLGTAGSDTEQGFCAIVSELMNSRSDRFFKQNDRAAVVLISDENDATKATDCAKYYYTHDHGPAYSTRVFNASRKELLTFFSYEYDELKDGITVTQRIQNERWAITETDISAEANGNCSSRIMNEVLASSTLAQMKEQARVHPGRSNFRNFGMSQCLIAVTPKIFNGERGLYPSEVNLPPETDLCNYVATGSMPRFHQTAYHPGYATFAEASPRSTCFEEPRQVVRDYRSGTTKPANEYFISSSLTPDQFAVQTLQNARTLFNDNFFMSFIVNDGTCPLQTGQSVGSRYSLVASQFPSLASTYPVCSSSYSSALDKVGQFAVSQTVNSLTLPGDFNLAVKVFHIKASGRVELSSNQYSVYQKQIQIRVDLQQGERIEIQYR